MKTHQGSQEKQQQQAQPRQPQQNPQRQEQQAPGKGPQTGAKPQREEQEYETEDLCPDCGLAVRPEGEETSDEEEGAAGSQKKYCTC